MATISSIVILDGVVWNASPVPKGGINIRMPSAVMRLTRCERKTKVAATNRQPDKGNEGLGLGRAVAKTYFFQNATGSRKISLAKVTDLHLTVAGLSQILQDSNLGEGPRAAQREHRRPHRGAD